ncbi:MAG: DUF7523 family protein [Halodesulfurarchaeum sp.]
MPSIASRTRRAVDRTPFLRAALQAGIVNYTATAEYLEVSNEITAVAAALRRYAAELESTDSNDHSPKVRMMRAVESDRLSVDGEQPPSSATAIALEGSVRTREFSHVLSGLEAASVTVLGAGTVSDRSIVYVDPGDGPEALRVAETVLES